jgi:hypothetical protein
VSRVHQLEIEMVQQHRYSKSRHDFSEVFPQTNSSTSYKGCESANVSFTAIRFFEEF